MVLINGIHCIKRLNLINFSFFKKNSRSSRSSYDKNCYLSREDKYSLDIGDWRDFEPDNQFDHYEKTLSGKCDSRYRDDSYDRFGNRNDYRNGE